eukprot:562581-Amphidinium_carterae.1
MGTPPNPSLVGATRPAPQHHPTKWDEKTQYPQLVQRNKNRQPIPHRIKEKQKVSRASADT